MEAAVFQMHNLNLIKTTFYKISVGVFSFHDNPLKNPTEDKKVIFNSLEPNLKTFYSAMLYSGIVLCCIPSQYTIKIWKK